MASPLLLIVPLVAALGIHFKPAPPAQSNERITLLPSQDGRASAVLVRSKTGETLIDRPYLRATVFDDGHIDARDEEPTSVQARYRSTLAAMPQAAAIYTVYFQAASDSLDPRSAELMAQLPAAIARRDEPEVIIVAHADRVETPGYNDELSLRRADAIRRQLRAAGIAEARIVVQPLGERELPAPTRDGTIEARNRRVDIRVR
jgi:outer membrane protein OmpA-like peptidoglycan-associated protein